MLPAYSPGGTLESKGHVDSQLTRRLRDALQLRVGAHDMVAFHEGLHRDLPVAVQLEPVLLHEAQRFELELPPLRQERCELFGERKKLRGQDAPFRHRDVNRLVKVADPEDKSAKVQQLQAEVNRSAKAAGKGDSAVAAASKRSAIGSCVPCSRARKSPSSSRTCGCRR